MSPTVTAVTLSLIVLQMFSIVLSRRMTFFVVVGNYACRFLSS